MDTHSRSGKAGRARRSGTLLWAAPPALLLALGGVFAAGLSLRGNGEAPRTPAAAVEIPVAVQDLAPDAAERRLRGLGLRCRREYRDAGPHAPGTLLRLEPPAGSHVPGGAEVLLVIAGTPPTATTPATRIGWTTDIGPDAPGDVAAKMLDVFRAHGLHVTFFVCGAWVDHHPDLVRRMAAEGHHIGNHTTHHYHLTRLSNDRIAGEIRSTEQAVVRLVGLQPMLPRMFRPPYGEENARVEAVIQRAGYRDTLWDIDPIDWDERRTSDRIASVILQRAKAGRIILTHVEPHTLQVLPAVLSGLRDRGLTPVSVPVVLGLSPDRAAATEPSPAPSP